MSEDINFEFEAEIVPVLEEGWFSNNMNFLSNLKEFLDNVMQEMKNTPQGYVTKVNIEIHGYESNGFLDFSSAWMSVKDNSVGIGRDRIAECLSLGSTKRNGVKDSLHEHGAGMKFALWNLGTKHTICTKRLEDDFATITHKVPYKGSVKFGSDRETFRKDESGTLIVIGGLKASKSSRTIRRKCDVINSLITSLGSTYEYVLKTNEMTRRKMEINVSLVEKNGSRTDISVEPVSRYYRDGIIDIRKEIEVKGRYSALLELGTAADSDEYVRNGIPTRGGAHPYKPWNKTISIVQGGRVLSRVPLQEFGVRPDAMMLLPIQGTLHLYSGFGTTVFKDNIETSDDNYLDLVDKVKEVIQSYMRSECRKSEQSKQNEISEEDIRDALLKRWRSEGHKVYKEHPVEVCGGRMDLLKFVLHSDEVGVCWETKAVQAIPLDLYQTLMYVENSAVANKEMAWLVAPSFSENCQPMADSIKKMHGLEIKLVTLEDLGIDFGMIAVPKKRRKRLASV